MTTTHGALTVITRIRPGMVNPLKKKLDEINKTEHIERNELVPFKKITSIHFARFVVLDEAKDIKGRTIHASLVFSTNYDRPLNDHIEEMVKVAGKGLSVIYSFCEGFNIGDDLQAYLNKNRKSAAAFYKGTPYRSVPRIQREAELYDSIQSHIDNKISKEKNLTPLSIRQRIIQFVKDEKRLSWVENNEDRTVGYKIWFNVRKYASLLYLGVLGIVVALLGIIPLRIKEKMDKSTYSRMDSGKVQLLVNDEDQIVQNQLTHLVDIKPGWFRLLILKFVLFAINILAIFIFNKGRLGSIPTIHFARWVIIDEGRRLLFFSNFDGSWENYLGDFIDKAAVGLTGVWSNTVGFPEARFLVFGGATDEQRFKAWTRNYQIPTQVWYSAYRYLSVQNINNNSVIRAGINKEMDEKEVKEWLQKF